MEMRPCSKGEALLAVLANRGVDYFFGTSGSDFVPLIEAFAKGSSAPKPVTVPHENVAVAMAMGHTLISGRAQAVMVHTNVGTANGLCQLFNASRLSVPMVFLAGRTPVAEVHESGGRHLDIQWTQEMFDQAGMVREMVRWDYELRAESDLEVTIDRAMALAHGNSPGPVYLSLPLEVISAPVKQFSFSEIPTRQAESPSLPSPQAIAELAGWVARSARPVITTTFAGRESGAMQALARLAERFAIPVIQVRPRAVCLQSNHPMHFGYDPTPWVCNADLILNVDSLAPWIPGAVSPPPDCRVVQLGPDPNFRQHPIRGYRADRALMGSVRLTLSALCDALEAEGRGALAAAAARRDRLVRLQAERRDHLASRLEASKKKSTIDVVYASDCINQVKTADSILIKESPLDLDYVETVAEGGQLAGASGLGWGLGGAMGAKLAAPDRLVIATEGDGSYMFGNPTAAHWVSAAEDIPFVTVIFNNARWESVRRSVLRQFPDGHASRMNTVPLTGLHPSPKYEMIVRSVDGSGVCVESADQLRPALEEAVDLAITKGRQAVVNVILADG